MQRFGQKLRSLRIQHGMTLKEMASELGYNTHSYLSEIEAGKKIPTVDLVLNAANLFSVTTDELLKDEVELTAQNLKKSRKR